MEKAISHKEKEKGVRLMEEEEDHRPTLTEQNTILSRQYTQARTPRAQYVKNRFKSCSQYADYIATTCYTKPVTTACAVTSKREVN